jgi:hypothetical protein
MHLQWLARPDTREVGMFLVHQDIPFHKCYHGGISTGVRGSALDRRYHYSE